TTSNTTATTSTTTITTTSPTTTTTTITVVPPPPSGPGSSPCASGGPIPAALPYPPPGAPLPGSDVPPPAPSGTWFPITFDASALWYKYFQLLPVDNLHRYCLDNGKVTTIDLAPGQYYYWTGSAQVPLWTFFVTAAGAVHYDPAYASFLSGEGTSTLTLSGFPVAIDASRLTGLGINLDNGPNNYGTSQ